MMTLAEIQDKKTSFIPWGSLRKEGRMNTEMGKTGQDSSQGLGQDSTRSVRSAKSQEKVSN